MNVAAVVLVATLAAPPAPAADITVREVGALEARAAALLYSGQEAGDLEVALWASAVPGDGATPRVAWILDVAGDPLLAALAADDGGARAGRVEIYVYALDAGGRLLDSRAQALDLAPAAVAELTSRGLAVLGDLALPPGDVELRCLVLARASGRLALRTVPLTVPPGGSGGPEPTFVDTAPAASRRLVHAEVGPPVFPLTVGGEEVLPAAALAAFRHAEASAVAAAPPANAVAPVSPSLLRTARVYRAALERRRAGDVEGAVAEMAELEMAAAAADAVAELAAAEVEVVRQIGTGGVEGVLPLVDLHLDLFERHHRADRYLLSTHSRDLAIRIAELYARESGEAAAGRRTAAAFVRLGAYLQEIGSVLQAEAAYERALAYDPTARAALVAVAAIRETYGDYRAALAALDRLRAAGGLGAEERLREAVNLRRTGKSRRAETAMRELADGAGPTWVAAVATQELAALLVADGRAAEARDVLTAAVERHPGVPRLRLQLAAVLDRLGEPQAATRLLAALDASARDVDSPRLLYGTLPAAPLAEGRRELAAAVGERLALAIGRLDALLGPAPS